MERRVLAIALGVIVGLVLVNFGAPVSSHAVLSGAPGLHEAVPRTAAAGTVAVAPPTRPAAPVLPRPGLAPLAPGILPASVTIILPNGTLAGHSAPIAVASNTYTLTSGFTGGILDERNGSKINGANKNLNQATGLSWTLETFQASDVTVENVNITNASIALEVESGSAITFEHSTVQASEFLAYAEYASGLNISNNVAPFTEGVDVDDSSGITVGHNNLTQTDDDVVDADDSSNIAVVDNQGYESDDGVYLDYGANAFVWGNNFSSTDGGIETYEFSNVEASWNNLTFCEYPIYFEYGSNLWGSHNSGQNASYAFYGYLASNVNLTAESFPGSYDYAIYAEYGSNLSFSGWNAQWTDDYVLYTYDIDGLELSNFDGNHSYWGMYFDEAVHVTVTNVQLDHLQDTYATAFETYEVEDGWFSDDSGNYDAYGYYDEESSDLVLTGDSFTHAPNDEETLYFDYDQNIQIVNCDLFNASDYAFETYFADNVLFEDNNASNAGYAAAYIDYGTNITLTGNNFDNARDYGLEMYDVTVGTITDNTLMGFVYRYSEGLEVEDDTDGLIAGNHISGANYSLAIEDVENSLVSDNNASDSYYGLYLYDNTNSSFVGNTLYNDHDGFAVGWNAPIWIYHNNFIDDAAWENDSSLQLIYWDAGYPVGGNYWSNWTTPDAKSGPTQSAPGADGIVDQPYVINGTNIDQYPLAQPWTTHTITFSETGLTPGTMWSVVVNGTTWRSATSTIVYDIPGAALTASYSFQVPKVDGYNAATPASGSRTNTGADQTVAVVFTPTNFTVTFSETGLPSGTSWSVVVNGKSWTGTGASIAGSLPNGTVHFQVTAVTNYAVTQNDSGSLTVAGAPVSLSVVFVQTASSGGTGNGKGGSNATTSNNGNSFSNTLVYALIGLVVLLAILTVIGFARGRKPGPTAAAAPWSPPTSPPPPAGGSAPPASPPQGPSSPPPGAMG